ncbi:hypothetical protein [Duganella callida]|uniref:Uncharacterized protein n=1 Tax=Duganella callida TaxID=2561932 RepID=A0A4Y9SCK5_9BURK|nr:hypothetical protein [Duganella callida]TFW20114.1 hypothetical protein E4L98_15405 [Duganella callida]
MPRPPFSLTDDQARAISAGVAQLELDYPIDPQNHRPFVRAFIRLVHTATGRFYSPAVYRRLLGAYAQHRRPSTSTLAAEKAALAAETTSVEPASEVAATLSMPSALPALIANAVADAMAQSCRVDGIAAAQAAFYADRLRETELELRTERMNAAQLLAALNQSRETAAQQAEETGKLRGVVAAQSEAITKLTAEVSDLRKFALVAIDDARGETRTWKDRAAYLESQRQLDSRLLETFRQKAYRNGADIPELLKKT